MTQDDVDDYFSPQDLVRIYGVKMGTIRQWMNRGKLPPPERQATAQTKRWSRKQLVDSGFSGLPAKPPKLS